MEAALEKHEQSRKSADKLIAFVEKSKTDGRKGGALMAAIAYQPEYHHSVQYAVFIENGYPCEVSIFYVPEKRFAHSCPRSRAAALHKQMKNNTRSALC